MEESERLYQEWKKMEGFQQAEAEENAVVNDPELQQSVLALVTMERILDANDSRIAATNARLKEIRKALSKKREECRHERSRIEKALENLTKPLIRAHMEALSEMRQRPKLSREILEKKYDGFSQKTVLSVETNERTILKIHQLVDKAIARIQSMSLLPISEIQAEFSRSKKEIQDLDWHITERLKMDESEYFRFSFPEGKFDPNYRGPLSGLH
jgi:hypothetical protein